MKSYRTSTVIIINFILTLFINHQNFSQIKLVNGIYYLEDQKMLDTTKINSNAALKKEIDIPLSFIKKDFKVNNTCGKYGSNQLYPDIAMGAHGDYILVWVDERTGAQEILAQIYNVFGEKTSDLIEVSNGTLIWNVAPNVIYNKVTREYLITWAMNNMDISLQRLDSNGNKIGNNIIVNNEFNINANNPSVAVDNFGNIMVTWYSQTSSDHNGPTIAFVKLFDNEMKPISYQRAILDETRSISSVGRDCRIASDTLNNFVIVWSSYEDNQSKIFLQKINTNQWTLEKNTLVSQSQNEGIFPTVTSTADGHFLITWTEANKGLAARLYNADSGFISDQFYIVQNNYYSYDHSSSSDEAGNFYVASGNWYPIIHKLNSFGKIVDSTQINNSLLKPYNSPKLSEVAYGSFHYAIYGDNNGDIDIQLGSMDSTLTRLSPDVLYEEDECSSAERKPKVKFNKDGNSIIVWESNKDGYRSIYGQTYDENFDPMSEELLISDSSKYRSAFNTNISTDYDGNYIITFSNEYYDKANVFQKISSNGKKLGSNIQLNKNSSNIYLRSNSDVKNNTLFTWTTRYGETNNYLYYQLFDSELSPLGNPRLLSLITKKSNFILDNYIDKNLNILVLWYEYDSQNHKYEPNLKAILFNKNGESISDTIIVYKGVENTIYSTGRCTKDGNENFIFTFTKWIDYSNPQLFVVRKYAFDKTYIDSFYTNSYWTSIQIVKFQNKKSLVTYNYNNHVYGNYYDDIKRKSTNVHLQNMIPYYPNPFDLSNNYSCDLYQDKLFLAYEIVKEKNKGIDIWANVQDFSDIYSEIDRPNDDDNEGLLLFNPYPNPSNTDITIEYIVKKLSCIKLIVYNSIGQVVKIIDQGVQYPGVYFYNFSIANLSSGVYFIGDFNLNYSIKKFIIIK